MATHVCPWWGGYFIDNRFRRLLHQPERILATHLRPGMTAMDFGCGMGFFSIPMARMVDANGTVIAVDLQPQMLRTLRKRAERAGVAGRIRTHACQRDSVGVDDPVDFVLAFWSAHEVPDVRRFLGEIHDSLVDGGKMMLVEPRGHVSEADFQQMTATAGQVGLQLEDQPPIRLSRAALFLKRGQAPITGRQQPS